MEEELILLPLVILVVLGVEVGHLLREVLVHQDKDMQAVTVHLVKILMLQAVEAAQVQQEDLLLVLVQEERQVLVALVLPRQSQDRLLPVEVVVPGWAWIMAAAGAG